MPVTAKLSGKFYEKLGDELTNELVEWFNQVDATYRGELRELNAVAATDPQRAYLTVSGFGSGHVFRTVDGGASWQDISSTLIDVPVNAILRLPGSDELYVGTDLGVFQSVDDGQSWAPQRPGCPTSL